MILEDSVAIKKLFSQTKTCCGYSKDQSEWDDSFTHPKHMFKPMDKKKDKKLANFDLCIHIVFTVINFEWC